MKNLIELFTVSKIESQVSRTTYSKALQLVDAGDVLLDNYNDQHVDGSVEEDGDRYFSEITLHGNKCEILCDCPERKNHFCVHVVALIIEYINDYHQHLIPSPRPTQKRPRLKLPYSITGDLPQVEITRDLSYHLSLLTVKDLRELARHRGIKVSGLKREIILDQLASGLCDPANLERAIQQLPSDSRLVLSYIAILAEDLNLNINPRLVGPKLDAALALQTASQPMRPAAQCLEDLLHAGLLFGGPHFLQVPLQVVAHREIHTALFKPTTGTKQEQMAVPFAAAHLAVYLLVLARSSKLVRTPEIQRDVHGWPMSSGETSSTGSIPLLTEPTYLERGLLNEIASVTAQDEAFVDLLAQILAEDRLWEEDKPDQLTTQFSAWLQLSPEILSNRLFHLASGLQTTTELTAARETGHFVVQRSRQSYLQSSQFTAALTRVRIRILDLVSRAPGETWFEIDHLLHTAYTLFPNWLEDSNPYSPSHPIHRNVNITIKLNGKPINEADYDSWVKTYGQLHLTMLVKTLRWLGLVDIAYQNDRPHAFRVTGFGEYLLGRRSDFPVQVDQKSSGLSFTSDGRLLLNPMLAHPELTRLVLQIAIPAEDQSEKTKKKLVSLPFAITLQGIQDKFEAGIQPESILTALEKAAGKKLPQNISSGIRQLWDRFGKLHLYPDMTLIEFADDYCLPELLAGTRLNQILLHTFSSRLIAIQKDGLPALMEELVAKGYTPRVEQEHHEE
jgi:hypothetical protein